jgi:hypothetical protein
LPSLVQKNQLGLHGNHQQNHQRGVVDQADQADLAADDHMAARADLAVDPVLVKELPIRTIRIFI